MSERRVGGSVVFVCDKCTEMLDTEQEDYPTAKKVRGQHGWVNLKHQPSLAQTLFCPECYAKYMGKAYVRN
jgi:hypothetical protein